MSLFDLLGVAGASISAHTTASTVASRNVANASTAGYQQQTPNFYNRALSVDVQVERSFDSRIESRLANARSDASRQSASTAELAQLEDEVGLSSLSTSLGQIFASFRTLSADPGSMDLRRESLANLETFARQVRTSADRISDRSRDIDRQIETGVSEANELLKKVASLAGRTDTEALDELGRVGQRLSELIGASVVKNDSGVQVMMGGMTLVAGNNVRELETSADLVTGKINLVLQGGSRPALDGVVGGELAGRISVRDESLVELATKLDALAFDATNAFNGVHTNGVGLDGGSGRTLFTPQAGLSGAAARFELSTDVAGHPEALGLSETTLTLPGDGRVAKALSSLESSRVASGGTQTLIEAAIGVGHELAVQTRSAKTAEADTQLRRTALESLHDSVVGVSIEEQLTSLSRYQRGFEAATKVLRAVDEMLSTISRCSHVTDHRAHDVRGHWPPTSTTRGAALRRRQPRPDGPEF